MDTYSLLPTRSLALSLTSLPHPRLELHAKTRPSRVRGLPVFMLITEGVVSTLTPSSFSVLRSPRVQDIWLCLACQREAAQSAGGVEKILAFRPYTRLSAAELGRRLGAWADVVSGGGKGVSSIFGYGHSGATGYGYSGARAQTVDPGYGGEA